MGKLALVALLVVGLLVALVFSVPVIRNDPGGSVDAYAVEAEKPSRIVGLCESACTLRLKTGCVTRGARLGFHSPTSRWPGIPLTRAKWEETTRFMASHYPPKIAEWFMAGPRHHSAMAYLSGSEAIALGARACR